MPNINVRDEHTRDACGGGAEAGSGAPEGDAIGVLLNAAEHVATGESVLVRSLPSVTSSSTVHQIVPEPLVSEQIYCLPGLGAFDPMISGRP